MSARHLAPRTVSTYARPQSRFTYWSASVVVLSVAVLATSPTGRELLVGGALAGVLLGLAYVMARTLEALPALVERAHQALAPMPATALSFEDDEVTR